MPAIGYSELVDVSLYRTLAWFDEELEAHSLSAGIFTRVIVTRSFNKVECAGAPTALDVRVEFKE